MDNNKHHWHTLSTEAVATALDVVPARGLSEAEAKVRLQ